MAAGLVYHNITTASGVTFTVASWVPDTGAPDVNAVPVHISYDATGTEVWTAAKITALLAALAAGATSIAKAEDAAAAGGDVGVPAMAIQQSSPADTAANGDYAMLQMSAGRLWTAALTSGDIAHDAADSGAPVKTGAVAIAHGTNPTAVAAADRTNLYANRAGIPFTIGGHPNVICKGHLIADSDGAQTDAALIGSISPGTKIVVTRLSAICDNANTGDCAITIGFGATNTPAPNLAGVAGVLVNGAFDGGAGVTLGDGSGIIGVGGDGEELRITCSDPAGGNIRVSYSYYTIES